MSLQGLDLDITIRVKFKRRMEFWIIFLVARDLEQWHNFSVDDMDLRNRAESEGE